MFRNWSTKLKVKVSRFTRKHSSGLAKTIFVFVIAAICFIPSYIGLLIWWLSSPSGFWQNFAVLALLIIVFGSIQAIAIFFSVILIITVLIKDL